MVPLRVANQKSQGERGRSVSGQGNEVWTDKSGAAGAVSRLFGAGPSEGAAWLAGAEMGGGGWKGYYPSASVDRRCSLSPGEFTSTLLTFSFLLLLIRCDFRIL